MLELCMAEGSTWLKMGQKVSWRTKACLEDVVAGVSLDVAL